MIMAKAKSGGKSKSVAKSKGKPDFKEPDVTVSGEGAKASTSGHTNDFEPGGGKKSVGSGGGDASEDTDAYETERKAQKGPSSDF
jgi:hypothetical protein